MNRENKFTLLIAAPLIALILMISQFILFNKGFFSISADEAGRTLEAFYFFKGDAGLFSIWLPFQKILYSISFSVFFDLIWVPRILSAFFGLFTLFTLAFLHYKLFDNIIGSFLTGLLSSIYFGIVLFSVLPLVEIYFFFFTVCSVAFLICWLKEGRKKYLWITLFIIFINNTTRYEAWIFALCILVIIIVNIPKGTNLTSKKTLMFSAIFITISFPVYWLYLGYSATGETSGLITSVTERYSAGGFLAEFKNSILYNFFELNIISLNILGLITFLMLYRKDRILFIYNNLFVATIMLSTVGIFVTKAMPTHNSWRVAVIWSILLIPYTAHWLSLLISGDNKMMKYSFALLIILIVYFFYTLTFNMTRESYMTVEDYNIGKIFNYKFENLNEEGKVLIAHNSWRYTGIALASQHPNRFITDVEFGEKHLLNTEIINKKYLDLLAQNEIQYLLLQKSHNDRTSLELVNEFEDWVLYRVPEMTSE